MLLFTKEVFYVHFIRYRTGFVFNVKILRNARAFVNTGKLQ